MDLYKTFNFENLAEYNEGSIISKQIINNKYGSITLFCFDKGQSLSEHTAPYDALVQMIDGKAEIKIDGNTHILNKNESIIMPANHSHSLIGIERFKMILTMIKC
jgi:quercetin dioxygenase-like cupin family protein